MFAFYAYFVFAIVASQLFGFARAGCSCLSRAIRSVRRVHTSHLTSFHFASLHSIALHFPFQYLATRSKMEVEPPSPSLRARRNMQPPVKQVTPVLPKKHVSASSVFKKQGRGAKKASVVPHAKANIPKLTLQEASDEKAQSVKSRSSSRSPQKDDRRTSRKRSDMHPLAIEFKGTHTSTVNTRRQLTNVLTTQRPAKATATTYT
jgi:hypothetical protein